MSKLPKKGRPTKYKASFCEDILEYFELDYILVSEEVASQGKAVTIKRFKLEKFPTIEGFCTSIDIVKDTLHQWVKKYPNFSDAYRKAKQKQKEILITRALTGEFNSSFSKFFAINCMDMHERSEVKTENEHKIEGYGLAFDLSKKPEEIK